jgi:hypothetical protein
MVVTEAETSMMRSYTVGGKKNGSGGRIEGPALFELVSSQPDFVNEVTLLQYFTEQRSVPAGCQLMLIHSPKCRPELAGEGIDKMRKRMKEEPLHGDVEGESCRID